MSKKIFGIIMVVCGILAFHLLGSEPETRAQWTTEINDKVYSDPVAAGGRMIFLGGDKGKKTYRLYELDQQGNKSAESVAMPVLTYQPLACGNMVAAVDKSNMIRGFSVPGLQLAWEAALQKPIVVDPAKTATGNLLVVSGRDAIFCLDSSNGQAIWDYQFTKPLAYFAVDQVLVCVNGHTDVKEPNWTMNGFDPETGEMLWSQEEAVSADGMKFVQGLGVTTGKAGNLIIFDQMSGQILYKHETPGLRLAELFDDRAILLAAGGSRIVCFSLMTGESWTTTLNSSFTGAAKFGSRLIFTTKKSIRCVDAPSGNLIWTRELGDIYNAFPFRKGIFITHKDSFFDRSTYGSYFSSEAATPVYTAYGRGLFMKPLLTGNGDLLLTYNGVARLMPPVSNAYEASEVDITPKIKDPEDKIRSIFAASETIQIKPGAATGKTATPTLTPDETEPVEDSDWTNDKP